MLSNEELNMLRKLAPRPRSGAFLCEEYSHEIREKGITLSVRLDYELLEEEIEFPDCASWRIAAFNFESAPYCHEGYTGTFRGLLQKACDDFLRVAGNYAPKARDVIMKSVWGMENFLAGRPHNNEEEENNENNNNNNIASTSFLPRPVLFRIRDPSGLTKTSLLSSHCMKILNKLRMKEVDHHHRHSFLLKEDQDENKYNEDDEEEVFTKVNIHLSKLLPIYQRTLYVRSWEEDKNLGLIDEAGCHYQLRSISSSSSNNNNDADNSADDDDEDEETLPYTSPAEIAKLIKKSKRICLLSGAGISVESGIKPFRTSSEEGKAIWKDFDATKMTAENFNTDDNITSVWWKMKRNLYREIHNAKPNDAHKFFGLLNKMDKLRGVITQNIDSLHLEAGVPHEKLVELHGHMRTLHCSDRYSEHNNQPIKNGSCDFVAGEPFKEHRHFLDDIKKLNDEEGVGILLKKKLSDADHREVDGSSIATSSSFREDFEKFVGAGTTNKKNNKEDRSWRHLADDVPLCVKCGCPLRTPTIMFGQGIPQNQWDRARRMIGGKLHHHHHHHKTKYRNNNNQEQDDSFCDLLIVVGTTLIVAPANDLPGQCLRNGVPVVIVNPLDTTMYDEYATGLIREPAGKFFAEVAKELGEEL